MATMMNLLSALESADNGNNDELLSALDTAEDGTMMMSSSITMTTNLSLLRTMETQ